MSSTRATTSRYTLLGVIAINLLTTARNMLPRLLADLSAEQDDRGIAATQRWAAEWADAAVMPQRTVWLPAVPRAGEVVYVDPYTEPRAVTEGTWIVEPVEGESHVQLHVTDVDLDVLGEDDYTVEMFTEIDWAIDQ